MTSKFENRLTMFRTVSAFFEKNMQIISTIPMLLTNVQRFIAHIQKIDQEAQRQALIRTGIAKDKRNSREQLVKLATTVSDIIRAFSAESSAHELYDNVAYCPSKLQRMRDSDLIEAASIISHKGNELGTMLDPYGCTTTLLHDLAVALTEFETRAPSPALAYSERATATNGISLLFKEANVLLNRKIDNNMTVFSTIDPKLLKNYRITRLIHDYPAGRRKQATNLPEESFIMGAITDTEGTPVEDTIIMLKPRDVKMDEIELEVIGDSEYYIESVPLGFWDMIVSKQGYLKTRIENFQVKKDDELTIDITLQPITDYSEEDT